MNTKPQRCPFCGWYITYSSDSFGVLRGGCLPCRWQTINGWYTVANRNKEVDAFIARVHRLYPTLLPAELQARLAGVMEEAGKEGQP